MNLNTTNKKEFYSDFPMEFTPHPDTEDLMRVTNVNSIKRALKNLIFTDKYERVFRPRYGCDIRRMLFENIDDHTITIVSEIIKETVTNFEPRVQIDSIFVEAKNDGRVFINLEFFVLNIPDKQTLTVMVERAR